MTTLPQLIANAVETNPDGVALVLADGTGPLEQVGYADLDAWSSRLARALIARGIGPEDLVAVAIPRSLDAVLAVWAVAKTGAGFVPIDPAYPPGWVAHLLVDAGAVYGLAVSWVRNELPEEIEWLQVDTVDTARSLEQFSADAVTYADRVRPLRAEHPAYVTYVADDETLPDGVVVTQAGLSGLCSEQQGRYRVEPDDRTLNFAPLPSDSSVLELLLALGGAATMVVVSPLVTRADELAALLRRTGATHAYLPADALDLIDPAGLDELGVVIAGRRPCPPETVQRWAIPVSGGSSRVLYQGYGPAEVTVMTNISSPLVPGAPLTLGAPIRGVTAHILDEQLAVVPDGAVGELYLGGLQLARGYHRRPGRTAQLLIADPFAADGSRLYRTGDLVRRGSGGAMEYVGQVELPDLEGPAVVSRPNHGETAVPVAGEPAGPETPAASGRWPAGGLPDYEQSLPIRDPADPGRQVRDTDPTANGFGTSGPDSGPGTSAPRGSDLAPSGSPEPVTQGHGFAGHSDRPSPDSLPEKGSRLASEQRDMELTGRGYLEMPDRQQTLPGRGPRGTAEPFEPAVADSPGPGLYGAPETAEPRAAEQADRGEPADAVLSQPGFDAAPERHRFEDSTGDWLRSGQQLPGPGDPANRFPAAADALPARGSSAPIPSDATAFYENPLSAGREPDRGTAALGSAQSLSSRPDWAVPPAWSAEQELPNPSGDGPGAPSDPGEPRPAGPPNPVERPATIPLSPGQLRLWERNQTAPGTTVETITAAMRLTGTLDAAAMQAAVADVVDRHETLRTVYPARGAAPQQVVLPREQAVPEVVAEPVPVTDLAEWLHALSQTDFDAAADDQVPVRFALAELGPREHVVAVVVHKILADDVSAGLLLRDLLRAFLGRRNRSRPLWQPLSIQYLDYFLGRRAELGDIADPDSLAARRLAYWREYLAELPPRLEFPADTAAATGEGTHAFDIGTRTHRRIAEIAQRAGTSEFIVLRAAFAVLLARSAAVADIVLGSSVRGSDERELDDSIGPYANTVILRTRIDPAESFLDLVQRVAESDRRAFANADLPFELLTEALGIDGSLFDVAIALRHNDIPRLEMPSLATEPVEVPAAPVGAALHLVIDPHRAPDGSPDGIAAAFRFAADRIGRTTVVEIARRFQRVLTVAGGDPDGPVGDIDLLSRADLDRLLVVWNDTRYPVAPELLLDGYRRTVAIRPDTVAVADSETELSYKEFDGRVNRLARRLIEAGVGAETVVGIATRCTPDLVVAIYAVLTAGGAYLPLDPRDPVHWTAQVLDTAVPAMVLADRASEPRAAEAVRASRQSAPVLLVDSDELGQYSTEPVRSAELARPARPGNAACVMCVSAAADGPELAILTHTALNNQVTLMLAQTPLGFTDVYLQRNAATVATSLWGFFLPLRAGAELVLTGPANTRQIAEAVTAHGVTVTDFGPAELAEFAELIDPGRVSSLREIFVTGEPLSPEIVSALRTRCGAQVHNLYGTCETAVSATAWPAAGSAERSVPIGLPQWNTRVYVLDSRLRPVPPGVPGELYLAGDQLARGYAGRAALTANRFVANPFGYGQRMYRTGDLVLWRDATHTTPQRLDLLGRTDHQIRFRGHRLRPHVIAAALRTLPGIADAAILARTVAAGNDPTAPGSRLAVYVVPEPGADPDLDQVRAGLARLLPVALLPVAYQAVEQIPLNSAGEPDAHLLPDPDEIPALTTALEPGPAESVAQLGSRGGEPAAGAVQTSAADTVGATSAADAVGDAGAAKTGVAGRPETEIVSGADTATAIGADTGPGDSAVADTDASALADAGVRSGSGVAAGARDGEPEAVAIGTGTSRNPGDTAAGSEPQRGPAVEGESSGGSEVYGELPATPTVIRLLDNPLPGVEVRSIVLDLPAGRPLDHTEAVVRALVTRHPLLSARLDTSDRSPTLWIPPREQRGDRQHWWLDPESGENTVATDDVVQAAADALDPATGRNIHFVVTGPESARRLVVVANGLVVDDRSWRVIVDELIAGDTAPAASESRLPQLVQALDQRARSIDLLDEAGWWRRNLAGARTAAPLGTVDLRARRRVSLAITAEGTAAVTAAAEAYQATVPEVLLTAVAIALRTGEQGAVVGALGSLVRYDADARSLMSRSDDLVGGFATEFPLSVQMVDIDTADALVGGPAAGAALTQIRDLVRSVPGGGAGYALLRYLSAETSAEFAAADSGRFTLRYRDLRPARVHTDGPADGVPLVLTVDVTDDGLLCRFDYATEVFVGEDVKTFAEHWVRALGGLAEHGLRPSPTQPPRTPTAPDPYARPAADPGATAGPDGYAPQVADSGTTAGPGPYMPSAADPYATGGADSYAPQTADPYTPPGYETDDSAADASAPPDQQPPTAPESLAEGHSDDRAWRYGGAAPQERADRETLPEHDPRTPVRDAEVTSLLRPITDPPHPPVGSGLPQRRRRTADPVQDAPEPAAEGLRQRQTPNLDDRAGTAADPVPSGLPQRRPRSQDDPTPPDPSAGPGLPQRRPQTGDPVAGTDDRHPGASPSGATDRPPAGEELGDSADQAGAVSRLSSSGLPQRRPQLAGRDAGPESRRPEVSLSGPDDSSGTGEEPGDLADPRGIAAGPGPGGPPQRQPRSRDDSLSPAGPILPQRGPEAVGQAAESGDEHPDTPAPGPGVPPRAAEEPSMSSSSGLPQRQPRLHDGPLLPESPSSSELPQRSRQSADRSAGGASTSGTEGLPQRQSRSEGGSSPSEPPIGSGLPQRSQNGSHSSEPPVNSGLPHRQPGRADSSLPSEPVPGPALPQRHHPGDEQLGETGAQPPASPLAGLVDAPQVNAGSGSSLDESAGTSSNGLPQRRPGLRDSAGSGDSGGSSLRPGLPQRRPTLQGGPDSSEQPMSARLPQRRPQPADHGIDEAHSGTAAQDRPATGADPQEAAPAAGPVSLPQRRPVQVEESADSGQAAEPPLLPQRRPESGGWSAPEAAAPLPQRRPELAAIADKPAGESLESAPGGEQPESTADPEPTTFLRPVTDVETTAYLSPIRDLDPRDDENTLLSLFDAQVARTPADPAVRQGARLLSYVELDRKSRALSVELIRFGVGAQTPVAVAMRPGIDLVVAVCAVLRAGGAYVPVDPGGSAEDLDRVLASAEPICVLSVSDDGVTTGTGIPVVAIDLLYLDLPTDSAADPLVAADDIADIRYRPDMAAGVAGTHRQMVERLRRAQRSHPYDSADLVLHAAPTVGDITLWELFRPLHSGAQILMPDHPGRAADLSRSIAAHKVTVVHVVPALLDRFLDSVTDGGGRAAHPSLRRLVVDGAALPSGGVERFMNSLPGAELVIWYGHNETGVITVGSVGGRPVTNDRVYLLDEQLRPVPPGTAGEMYIGGPQLARGFYDAPAGTAVHFVAAAGGGRLYRTGDIVRRREGVLEYLGRTERHGGSLPVGSRRGGHD